MPVPVKIIISADPNVTAGIMDQQFGRADLVVTPPNTNVSGGVLPITAQGYAASMIGMTIEEFRTIAAWYMAGGGQVLAGSEVRGWLDISGNLRHLEQGVAASRPALQSDYSILFDGVDDFLATAAFAVSQPVTIYIVASQITWTSNDIVFDAITPMNCMLSQGGVSPQVFMYAGSIGPVSGDWPLDTRAALINLFNGASSSLWVNGAETTGDTGAGGLDGFTLGSAGGGGSNFANVRVWEVMIRSGADSVEMRQKINDYFKRKYNL